MVLAHSTDLLITVILSTDLKQVLKSYDLRHIFDIRRKVFTLKKIQVIKKMRASKSRLMRDKEFDTSKWEQKWGSFHPIFCYVRKVLTNINHHNRQLYLQNWFNPWHLSDYSRACLPPPLSLPLTWSFFIKIVQQIIVVKSCLHKHLQRLTTRESTYVRHSWTKSWSYTLKSTNVHQENQQQHRHRYRCRH